MEAVNPNYSIDMLKKAAFIDEIRNVLEVLPLDQRNNSIILVIEYLEKRLKQIDNTYKK